MGLTGGCSTSVGECEASSGGRGRPVRWQRPRAGTRDGATLEAAASDNMTVGQRLDLGGTGGSFGSWRCLWKTT